jgi:transcriptional regulator of arginine metabolism
MQEETMDRSVRLARLRHIIETQKIKSQEVLLRYLCEEGFQVTQATLSRDLKYLKVGKVPDGRGGYIYTFSDSASKVGSDKSLVEDFRRGFISLEFSGNQGVIKTLPGHASTVAFAIDNLNIGEVLGTIAGDDTILVVPRDGVSRNRLLRGLRECIPGLEEEVAE